MRAHGEGTFRARDGLLLYWQEWLPDVGADAAVVLLHGGAEHGGRYGHLVTRLVDDGLSVHALDLRGHGRSEGRRGSLRRFEDYIDDVERFVQAVSANPVFLIGYSLGGLVSLTYALDHQEEVAGVVAAGPALGVGEQAPALVFGLAKALSAVAPRLRVFRLDPEAMMQDPAAVRAYREDPLVFHGRFEARLLGEFMRTIERVPRDIGRLRVPLLIVHGAADVSAHPQGSVSAIENAGTDDKTLRLYDGMRHDVFNEPGRDQVCSDVAEWIHARLPVAYA